MAELNITDLIRAVEASSGKYEPKSDEPNPGAFGTTHDQRPWPWSERKLRTWETAHPKYKKREGEKRKAKTIDYLIKDILGEEKDWWNRNYLPDIESSDKEEKSIIKVFGEKSKDADEMLNQEEMIKFAIDTAIGSTPVGAVSKGGKGIMSFLKGLLGRAKSKVKFPEGYGYPTKSFDFSKPSVGVKSSPTKPTGIRQFGKFNRQKWEK